MDKARFQEMAEVTGIFNGDTPTMEEVFEYLKPDNLTRLFGCPGESFERYTAEELNEFACEIVRVMVAQSAFLAVVGKGAPDGRAGQVLGAFQDRESATALASTRPHVVVIPTPGKDLPIPADLKQYAGMFGGGRVTFCTAPTFPPEAPATAPDGPTVAEAKRQLEQAAQSLTGDMRAAWEGMGTTDRNEMVIEVQRGKDAAEVVRAWCVIE